RRQHGDIHARLTTAEDTAAAQVFEKTVNVQWIAALQPPAEILDQLVGAAHRIDAFAATPYALVGMDLHEQAGAAANVSALQLGDAQVGWHGRQVCPVDGLRECSEGVR